MHQWWCAWISTAVACPVCKNCSKMMQISKFSVPTATHPLLRRQSQKTDCSWPYTILSKHSRRGFQSCKTRTNRLKKSIPWMLSPLCSLKTQKWLVPSYWTLTILQSNSVFQPCLILLLWLNRRHFLTLLKNADKIYWLMLRGRKFSNWKK